MRHTRPLPILLFRSIGASALICLLGVAGTLPAWADSLPADRVKELRQSLRENKLPSELDTRKRDLQKRIAALHGVSELSRAFLAEEWSETGLEATFETRDFLKNGHDARKLAELLRKEATKPGKSLYAVTAVDLEFRSEIADRFEKAARTILEGADATSRLAVANLIGEIGVKTRNTTNVWLIERVPEFSPVLILAMKDQDSQVRRAAARSLGKINADSAAALTVLANSLEKPDVNTRRAAGEALSDMMSRYSPTELGGKGLFLRLYLQARGIDAAPRILPVAGRGLGDKDADVRRACI